MRSLVLLVPCALFASCLCDDLEKDDVPALLRFDPPADCDGALCDEAEARMGGAFVPPPIPGTTRTCVERMSSAWTLTEYAARPVSITWECRR